MEIALKIAYTSFGSTVVPITLFFIQKKKLSFELHPIGWVVIVSFIADAISFYRSRQGLNTHIIGNIYLAAQFLFLIIMFGRLFRNKKMVVSILMLFIPFYLINISFYQGPWVFNSITNIVASLISILLCIYYFYQLISELPVTHVQDSPMFWICFAILAYYSGNFFLFITNNYFTEQDASFHRLIWILHNLLNIIKHILFSIGLWQSFRKVRSSTLSSSAP